MARGKVKLEWMVNDAARKASFRKRKAGMLKKVKELTTLCGIEATAIIYHPEEIEPTVWPSSTVAHELLRRYESKSDYERAKKKVTHESYLNDRKGKLQEENWRQHKKNMDMDMDYLMKQLYTFNGLDRFEMAELYRLAWLTEEKMKDIRKRIDYVKQIPPLSLATSLGASSSEPCTPPPSPTPSGSNTRGYAARAN